jgi:hypothetical protein
MVPFNHRGNIFLRRVHGYPMISSRRLKLVIDPD